MSVTSIGVIGGSWRAEYYLRIADEAPEMFTVRGVLVRSGSTTSRISAKWGVPSTTNLAGFLALGPYDYVVVSVPRSETPGLLATLAAHDIPALCETPPADALNDLRDLWAEVGGARIQVAEQYRYQPHHGARLAVGDSGLLGRIHTARASVAHDYHGVALLRTALHAGFGPVAITGQTIPDRVIAPRGRDGWNDALTEYEMQRVLATLDFGSDVGVGEYDFLGEQYVSPIRGRRFELRGERGELSNDRYSFLLEAGLAASGELVRVATGIDGDLEGSFLRRIMAGRDVLWENPLPGARLNDDELAVADVMARMAVYAAGGEGFYGLADGCHDHYLGMLIAEASSARTAVESAPQPWSDAHSDLA